MTSRAGLREGLIFAALALLLLDTSAIASERADRGHALLKQHCGSCHAVEKVGRSPRREAPPFRLISRRYEIDVLVDKLHAGLVSYHRDMPDFRFSRQDARAVGAYLGSIQE